MRISYRGSHLPQARARGALLDPSTLEANWLGSRAIVAIVVQFARRGRLASGLRRNAAYESGAEGSVQQDRSQRCARHRPDDAGGALPSGACKDATSQKLRMLLTQRKLLQSKAITIERPARYFAQLRPQGWHGWDGEVRGTHLGACREPSRPGSAGRTAAHCPPDASRTVLHPASPPAGHCPG